MVPTTKKPNEGAGSTAPATTTNVQNKNNPVRLIRLYDV